MRRAIGIVLLLLGLAQLGYHEGQRIIYDVPAWDFDSVYAAARTWVHGGNPYDQAAVVETWRHAGWFPERDVSFFATVYPPSSLTNFIGSHRISVSRMINASCLAAWDEACCDMSDPGARFRHTPDHL